MPFFADKYPQVFCDPCREGHEHKPFLFPRFLPERTNQIVLIRRVGHPNKARNDFIALHEGTVKIIVHPINPVFYHLRIKAHFIPGIVKQDPFLC